LERTLDDLDTQAALAPTGIETTQAMDTTITEAWKGISEGLSEPAENIARDEAGRFTKKAMEAAAAAEAAAGAEGQTADVTAQDPNAATEQAAPEAKKAPASWKKEAQETFGALPPHVQDEVLRRESDFHKGIEGYKTEAQRAKVFDQAIAPYMQTIQKLGVAPQQAVAALMKADHTLRYAPPAVKQAEFMKLAKVYSIDLGQQIDPNVAELQRELYSLRESQRHWQEQNDAARNESLNSDIERFASEPGHEHFAAVRDHMAALLQGGQAKDLPDAYAQAVWANPQTREALLAKQRDTERAEATRKANEAKKAAAPNVPQRGTVAATGPRLSWEEQIKADAVRLGLAH
jgi:hypothetical protein